MREAVRIRKAEEATALGEVSVRNVRPSTRDFLFAVMSRRSYLAFVPGVVRRDPGSGFDRAELDVGSLARTAQEAGAGALAIASDGPLFGGSIDEFHAIARDLEVPVLRLDYVLDVRQLYAARLAGADAVLLSAGMMDVAALQRLVQQARAMHMHAVVESRDDSDLGRALQVPGAILGLGDLTGETSGWDPARVLALAGKTPPRSTLLALSGVRGKDDFGQLEGKVDAALVVAPWLGSADPAATAAEFFAE
jgi:indole-3-glycerol phosphate synthase